MKEPSLRSSRLALASGMAAILIVGGGGFLLGRSTSERPAVVASPLPIVVPAPAPSPITTDAARRVLNRADLIALAATAADAASAGRATPAEIISAEGRRFEVRLPFGCGGPAAKGSDAAMRWRYDENEGVLRVHVAPVVWAPEDWWTAPPPSVEAIEGFWIARPWSSSEACPAATGEASVAGAESVTLPGQTLAVAQVFVAGGARQGRRDGKPFETSARLAPDSFDGSRGLRVRLAGRIGGVPGGGPALCRQPGGAEQRPICVIAVAIDEVAIEHPVTGETLATWSVDRRD